MTIERRQRCSSIELQCKNYEETNLRTFLARYDAPMGVSVMEVQTSRSLGHGQLANPAKLGIHRTEMQAFDDAKFVHTV